MKTMPLPPVICYTHSGKTHYVFASGGPEDGSLHGMYTYCSRLIDLEALPDGWVEDPSADVTCGTCRNSERAGRPHREATYYKNAYALLFMQCEALVQDADARPGAYLHSDIGRLRAAIQETTE